MPRAREYRTRDEMERFSSIVMNIIFFVVGLLAFFNYHISPPSIEATLFNPVIHAWGLILMVASPMVVLGRLKSHHRVESLGDLGVGIAFLIYTMSILVSTLPQGLPTALLFLAISFSMLYRGYKMNRLAKEVAILDGRSPIP